MMGCFFACFSSCKHRKHRHLVHSSPSKHPHGGGANEPVQLGEEPTKLQVSEEPIKPVVEFNDVTEEKLEEQLSFNVKKKVTFDLDVKTDKAASTTTEVEVVDRVVENNETKECEDKEGLSNQSEPISRTVALHVESNPPNHRYQDCSKGEEYEELDLGNSDLDETDNEGGCSDDQHFVQPESSGSLFSISIDSRKQVSGAELGEKEVTSPLPRCGSPDEEPKAKASDADARGRNQCMVDSVLNPVENLIQWKSVKVRRTLPLQHQDKENINLEQDLGTDIASPERKIKLMSEDSKPAANKEMTADQDIAVDTSLSSWLATPVSNRSAGSVGNSPSGRERSPKGHEDRPILGALTVEELKQLSASTPPRRARSKSPDETPIIGTVGRYWVQTGRMVDSDSGSSCRGMPSTTSRNREVEKEKRDTTPFIARLERAAAQV
ncbi:hypothetical protein Tsubulata_008831 [Turnera subulata]|uniref:Uncharacterized protein n=1 Tax=Turnera subulata TaxID=218843 RepID=A0A9Q0J438_9ROSI|nr:hypothetical protein Tsubulata_008831 [Turnera subulata]